MGKAEIDALSLPTRIYERMKQAGDSEHEQMFARSLIVAVAMNYVLLTNALTESLTPQDRSVGFILAIAFGASLVLPIWRYLHPVISPVRRVVGILQDNVAIATVMIIGGEPYAWFVGFHLLATMANGVRYGRRYLLVSGGVSVALFTMTLILSPYWKSNPHLGWGSLAFLAVLPAYLFHFLSLLHSKIKEAIKADQLKSRFLAHVSQQIRTPLNAIVGASELLKTSEVQEEKDQCVDVVATASDHLLNVVQEILDITAIENDELIRDDSSFDPRSLCQGVTTLAEPAAMAKGLSLQLDIDPTVPLMIHADAVHLRQVLVSLVNNAIRFSEEGQVILSVKTLDHSNKHCRLRFAVTDTSQKVPANRNAEVFEPFARLDSLDPEDAVGGAGLGLSIAHSLVHLMGGQIGCRESTPQGMVFWFEIPVGVVSSEIRRQHEGALSNVIPLVDPYVRHRDQVPKLHILIVEDQPTNRLIIEGLLKRVGHDVTCAITGEEAQFAVENNQFDLIVLDLGLPDMHGHEFLKVTRALRTNKQIPVIVLTADATPEALRLSKLAGASGFLTKPVTNDRLLEAIALCTLGPDVIGVDNPNDHTKQAIDLGAITKHYGRTLSPWLVGKLLDEAIADVDESVKRIRSAVRSNNLDQVHIEVQAIRNIAISAGATGMIEVSNSLLRKGPAIAEQWSGVQTQLEEQIERFRSAVSRQQRRQFRPRFVSN